MLRVLILIVVSAALASSALAQRVLPVDRIVAVVGRDVVTMTELQARVGAAERELRRQGTALPDRKILERQVLEQMILQKAQLRLAQDTGIQVDDVQLDRAIERIAEGNRLSLREFRSRLERDGVSFEQFREEVREQILIARVREREVDNKIQVSETEIDLYLEETKAPATERVEYDVAHILVRVPEQANPDQIATARARVDKVREEALAGADFAQLAATYSDGPNALRGGALGWRGEDRLPDLFTSALKGLKQGELSEVLRSPAGFHVLKLLGRRSVGGAGGAAGGAAAGPQVVQTHARHILVKTSEAVSQDDARRRLLDLRERMARGGADFAELARLHSEDATAARGGDLGWLYPGDTVPDFERAMDALQPGEVSLPVQSPFGWHLIQVLERRKADMSADRVRLRARQVLRERKSEEAYQEWLRQLRDQTYVELRLEDR
ncbi:MAG: molecular chaperone SurA [Betaproteobacteria bacterium SG8_39]|nr:MAG: molecular chaperone SurA [Betaproteobacteria bacterium SG8_39]